MADFMTLKAKLSLDSSEYDSGLDKAEKKGKGFGSRLAGGAKALAKGFAVASAAAAGGVAVLTKNAVAAYAEYEQLAGGVKKLYGDAADELMSYAEKGYITSGMSANKYMEMATSFSASLINSLGGDASAAAKQTDVAMKAISDNFNTFGGDISNIQNAYAGFAKQNYTMLDNLKLGYGGTKTEMERLIADANEYAEANGMAADLSIDSFADIVQAIDLIQQKQGIAGATAKEAATTIEGSLNMTKAAWENLMAGFANPDADIGALVEDVITSAGKAAENLVPAIIQAVGGIRDALSVLLPQAFSKLPELIKKLGVPMLQAGMDFVVSVGKGMIKAVPQLIGAVASLVGNIKSAIGNSLPDLIEQGLTGLEQFSATLRSSAGKLVDVGLDLIQFLAQGIADAIPALIKHVPTIISNFAGIINDNAPKVISAGVKIIVTLVKGLVSAIPVLVSNLPKIIRAIWDVFTAVNWLSLGKTVLTAVKKGIEAIGKNLPNVLKGIGKKALNAFKGISWRNVGTTVINLIGKGISSLASLPGTILKKIGSAAMKIFTGIAWGDLGTKLMKKIGSGIVAATSLVTGKIKELIDKIKSYFPFNIGKVFKGKLDLPSVTVTQNENGAQMNSSIRHKYFAKAMSNPYMFRHATEFYAGDAGDEMLYGHNALMDDISEASGGKTINITNNITVNNADDPELFADRLTRRLELNLRSI